MVCEISRAIEIVLNCLIYVSLGEINSIWLMRKPEVSEDLQAFDPIETSLKTFFLGPKSENADLVNDLISEIFQDWYAWRKTFHPEDGVAITEKDKQLTEYRSQIDTFKSHVTTILRRFNSEIPTFNPRYIGHMVAEISLPALMGHFITLLHNPNNITGEASRIGIKIEDEAISDLATMLGFNPEQAVGHFTSGGTVANFEGLLRARMRLSLWLTLGALAKTQGKNLNIFDSAHMGWEKYNELYTELGASEKSLLPYHILKNNPYEIAEKLKGIFGVNYRGPVILVPQNKHYSWEKAVRLIGLGDDAFWPVKLDYRGKMDVLDLKKQIREARLQNRPILMVVSVAGTTEMGDFDPINEVDEYLKGLKEHDGIHIWHHIDAAYGGFFCALEREENPYLSDSMKLALNAMGSANSITIDPHKLGYVPYASGAFITQNKNEYYLNTIHAPYIDFKPEQDKGPQTIEGSRSAAGAVSTWLTSKTIGFDADGYGMILNRTIKARVLLEKLLAEASPNIFIAPHSETNICLFTVAKPYEPLSMTNRRTLKLYEQYSSSTDRSFFVSKTQLGMKSYGAYIKSYAEKWNAQLDEEGLVLIRLTLMNPFFTTNETKVSYPEAFVADILASIKKLL
ncbi:decarboxylase [bacterium]|nr:MAG: decarboxylase [bacterium]